MSDMEKREDIITEGTQQCMGVPAIATSAGIGVTFGVSIVVSGATLGAGAIITLVVFISVEGIRNALWKRDTVATILEAKLMDALMSVNINLKIQKDFEQNLDELKKKLMGISFESDSYKKRSENFGYIAGVFPFIYWTSKNTSFYKCA